MIKPQKTLNFNWSDKHMRYMKKTQQSSMNIAEGSIRSGKTTDNIFCFAHDLKKSKDKLHLATASTQPTAKIIIGDCDGFGLEHIFRGQCKWGKYRGNECLRICGKDTGYKEKIVLFCGGAKADSYKKFRGMSIGLWIATEINLHHAETIREAQRRQINADIKRFYWDLNPDNPNAEIYTEFIDVYEKKDNEGTLKGGFNLCKFNIFDNVNLSEQNRDDEISKYEVGSVYYKRDILGERCTAQGIIFRDFAENVDDYIIADVPKFKSTYMGYDLGGHNSAYALVSIGVGYDGVVYVQKAKKIKAGQLKTADVDSNAIEFINYVEGKYNTQIERCGVDDAYYTTINDLNAWRYMFYNAAEVKGSMPLYDRPMLLSKLMAQGKFKLVAGECDDLIDELKNIVYDDKAEKDIPLDNGTVQIDCYDALFYALAPVYHYLKG